MTKPAQIYVHTEDGRDVPIDEAHAEKPIDPNPNADLDAQLRGTVVNGRRRWPSQGQIRAVELERIHRADATEAARMAREGRQASEIIDALGDASESEGDEHAEADR